LARGVFEIRPDPVLVLLDFREITADVESRKKLTGGHLICSGTEGFEAVSFGTQRHFCRALQKKRLTRKKGSRREKPRPAAAARDFHALQHFFFVVKARIFADRAQPAPYAESGLRPVNEIRQDSDERWNSRHRSQSQHRDRGSIPLVFVDLVRE
jgi:hypothetical protein